MAFLLRTVKTLYSVIPLLADVGTVGQISKHHLSVCEQREGEGYSPKCKG